MIENPNIKLFSRMIDISFNYDMVRRFAVHIFNRSNSITGISEKCKILYNPYPFSFIECDELNEKYFSVVKYDKGLTDIDADNYKKSFAYAFEYLYTNNKLIE